MTSMLMKDRSIWVFLGQLADEIECHHYQVVDFWDADLFAVGIAAAEEPRRLVYISTFKQAPGRFAYECEEPTDRDQYHAAERRETASFDEVVEVIRRHLRINRPVRVP